MNFQALCTCGGIIIMVNWDRISYLKDQQINPFHRKNFCTQDSLLTSKMKLSARSRAGMNFLLQFRILALFTYGAKMNLANSD